MTPQTLTAVQTLAERERATWPLIGAELARAGVPTNHVSDHTLAESLRRADSQLAELRDQRKEAATDRDKARQAWADAGKPGQTSAQHKAAVAANRRVGKLDDQIAAATEEQASALAILGGGTGGGVRQAAQAGIAPYPGTSGWDSSGVLDSATTEELAQLSGSRMAIGRRSLGEVASRDALAMSFDPGPQAADITGTASLRRGTSVGIAPQLRRPLRILDLLGVGTMDGQSLPYTQEGGSLTTAAETGEGAVKPEAAMTLTDAEAEAKTIAHWLKVRKQALADAPALKSTIDSRLRYGVERRLQDQIVGGNGSGDNLRGILNTSGIGSVAYSGSALLADQVLNGITAVHLADGEANAIVMHPTAWRDAVIAKAQGDGHYFSGGPYSVTNQQMWGVPLIASASIPAGTVLVGDFALGAVLYIREGVNVLLSDSDQDDFVRNRVTLLAEMRAALAVFRPAVFCAVALTA